MIEDNDGWGKKDNIWEYSYHITKDNYKDLGYSEYMDAGNIFSTQMILRMVVIIIL
jgi:hypothetical protein